MINFRFHLVSLTAVFLALCIGIAVGAAVVDQATVDFLESRLKRVEARLDSTDSQNTQLRAELERWDTFALQSRDDSLAGRLAGVPVLVLATRGMDRRPVDDFRQSLAVAGATLTGTVWFTSKLQLGKEDDVTALADVLGITAAGADPVRRSMVNVLSAELAGQSGTGLLRRLREDAFVEVDSPAGSAIDPTAPPPPGTLIVVASDADAVVPNEQLAQPLAAQLAQTARGRVLAVEPGHDADGPRRPARRALFVGPLRADNQVSPLLSTVDDLEDVRGRFAAVFALRDLGAGKVGHYGVGPGATRLVPEAAG